MRRGSALERTLDAPRATYSPVMPTDRSIASTTCPSCGHSLSGAPADSSSTPPAESVRVWMTEQNWDEPLLTRDVYAAYLIEYGTDAVDRDRFVRDLARFGVHEGTDGGGRLVLTCPGRP